jgi:hypothetical protein
MDYGRIKSIRINFGMAKMFELVLWLWWPEVEAKRVFQSTS